MHVKCTLAALAAATQDLSHCSGSSAHRAPGSGFERPPDQASEQNLPGASHGTALDDADGPPERMPCARSARAKRPRLFRGGVTDEGAVPLLHALRASLEELRLATTGVGDATLRAVGSKLTCLDLSHCKKVSDSGGCGASLGSSRQ
eukprot:357392-Chlamydomonas_euryale.AAC.27